MLSLPKKFAAPIVICMILLGLLSFSAACTHRKIVQLGSHKITVSRHGFEKKFHIREGVSEPTFEYAGISTAGEGLKVSITGDNVNVNGLERGKLRPGDSVYITDDGVAVNSLDYGESEKYLRANSSPAEASGKNNSASNDGLN